MKTYLWGLSVFILAILFITTAHAQSTAPAAQSGADASITGLSTAFNPAISLNGLFYGLFSDTGKRDPDSQFDTGFHLQELELAISANVDPYLRADATISWDGDQVSVENLYLTTLQMPARLQAKVGKLNIPFGLYNKLHTHAQPFIEPPLINQAIFGAEGWKDIGATLDWTAPLPWFLQVSAGGFDGADEGLFKSDRDDEYAGFSRIENLFDLSDAATLRLGGSYAFGPTVLTGDTFPAGDRHVHTQIWGADLQFKWRPPKYQRSRALILQSEYLEKRWVHDNGDIDGPIKGYYVHALAQVSQYWWLQARYDWMSEPGLFLSPDLKDRPDTLTDQGAAFAVAFVPTHFQAYKLEYSVIDRGGETESRAMAQINFTIGSHPAHEY